MRHRVYGRHLGRNKDERGRLFKSLIFSLFSHGTIETSESKAKAIKGLIDKIITLGKSKNTQHLLQSYFSDKNFRERVISDIMPKLAGRSSGYTTSVKLGTKSGDRTMRVRVSLIGAEKLEPFEKGISVKPPKASLAKGGRKAVRVEAKKVEVEEIKTAKKALKSKPKAKGDKKLDARH